MKQDLLIKSFKELALREYDYKKISDLFSIEIEEAILIRLVENTFLDLFAQGSMNGTIHTCVGQEFSAVAICSDLLEDDWVTSNHRCHGHFISKTKKWGALIDELRGLESGVCKGIGSSQHLFDNGFLSNGPQGSLLPVAVGIAYYLNKNKQNNIAVSFIGEGTLGEGVLYETLNLSSLLDLPHLFVLENNLYSQSTSQADGISGEILDRPKSFNIKCFEANTWDLEQLFLITKKAKNYVRENKKPALIQIKTYRLNAHSKSDDDRDPREIEFFYERDPLVQLLKIEEWANVSNILTAEVDKHIDNSSEKQLNLEDYSHDQLPREMSFKKTTITNPQERMVTALNRAYKRTLEQGSFFIGEDIADPYGGAFKVTKGFSDNYPDQVISSPISEAAIVGFGLGLSLMGNKPFIEIMFGDFCTNIFDQLITNASKFYHMYAFQCSAPIRVRTPMGGKRGYGPTHSQSLEKLFLGIDNLSVIALTSLEDPTNTIDEIQKLDCPVVILENKTDYGKFLFQENDFLKVNKIGAPFGLIHASPIEAKPNLTVVSYGGTAREIVDAALEIFLETDFAIEVFTLTCLHPLNIDPIVKTLKGNSHGLVVVEDHSVDFGVGAELICQVVERGINTNFKRIGAKPYPIPSVKELEDNILPTKKYIISALNDFRRDINV